MGYILGLGMLPPIALLIFIYHLDKVEKEPPKLILWLFLCGCFAVIPAIFLEGVGEGFLEASSFAENSISYLIIKYFLIVAFSEELCKRLVAVSMTRHSNAFDYQFDAIVYCTASALGFACIENIMYIALEGASVALGRLIPIHTICGIYMGHFVGLARTADREGKFGRRARLNTFSILIPILIHGFYDFSLGTENDVMIFANLIFTVIITVVAFISLGVYAKRDRPV